MFLLQGLHQNFHSKTAPKERNKENFIYNKEIIIALIHSLILGDKLA
jgi:hypothetical protein